MKKEAISNPDKVLFPVSGITKKQLAEYYAWVAPYMLKHLKDRPLSLQRYPEGIKEEGFFQKDVPEYYPAYIKRVEVAHKSENKLYAVVDNRKGLVYLANMAAITMHTWQSKAEALHCPDQLMWDLDPSDNNFEKVKIAARLLRYMLGEIGLEPWLKLTGSRGLHLCIPIHAERDYAVIKPFTKDIADFIAAKLPELFTTEIRKNKRGNKIFVDYLRNGYGHTAAAAYTVRLLEGAPVACPISWDELEEDDIAPGKYNIFNLKERLEMQGDSWENFYKEPQDISPAIKEIERLKARS